MPNIEPSAVIDLGDPRYQRLHKGTYLRRPCGFAARPRKGREYSIDISDPILDETAGVLREKFKQNGYTIHDAIGKLLSISNRVFPTVTLGIIREDPDDNRILECAVEANSDFIVTEDKDLLRVGQYRNARVVTIRDFIKLALSPSIRTIGLI